MNCNQCEFLFINGVGCHETGCPNSKSAPTCFRCGFSTNDDGECDCMVESAEVAQ